jgi:hypothetical protein
MAMRRLVLEQPLSRAAVWSVRLGLFALVVTLYGVAVVRSGQQEAPGLAALGSGFVLALLALGTAVAGGAIIWNRGSKGAGRVAAAALLGAAILLAPAYGLQQYLRLPALTDISTDIDDPPAFSRSRLAMAARAGHVPRELTREQRRPQREAYQRLTPIVTDLSAEDAFEVAVRASRNLGWEIIEGAAPGGRSSIGRIDAIARTRILRLTADVTVRVRPRVDGSRIDVRSASRLGGHDLGDNAQRIRAFVAEVQLLIAAR